jgi:hypothetical protein
MNSTFQEREPTQLKQRQPTSLRDEFIQSSLFDKTINSIEFTTKKPKLPFNNERVHTDRSFYGLPIKVKDLLKCLRHIESLYDWQDELLTKMIRIYDENKIEVNDEIKKNLLYLSPTSGGKTLVNKKSSKFIYNSIFII